MQSVGLMSVEALMQCVWLPNMTDHILDDWVRNPEPRFFVSMMESIITVLAGNLALTPKLPWLVQELPHTTVSAASAASAASASAASVAATATTSA